MSMSSTNDNYYGRAQIIMRLRDIERMGFDEARSVAHGDRRLPSIPPGRSVSLRPANRELYDHDDMVAREALQSMRIGQRVPQMSPVQVSVLSSGSYGGSHQQGSAGMSQGRGRGSSTQGRRAPSRHQVGASGEYEIPLDDYDELLRLDENNVKRGVSLDEQRKGIKTVVFDRASSRRSPSVTSSVAGRRSASGTPAGRQTPAMGDTATCLVCHEDFKDREKLSKIPPCGHLFHYPCIAKWFEKERTCPVCRAEFHV